MQVPSGEVLGVIERYFGRGFAKAVLLIFILFGVLIVGGLAWNTVSPAGSWVARYLQGVQVSPAVAWAFTLIIAGVALLFFTWLTRKLILDPSSRRLDERMKDFREGTLGRIEQVFGAVTQLSSNVLELTKKQAEMAQALVFLQERIKALEERQRE